MREFDVACGIVEKQGKLLIAQRNAEDFLGGYWEFPGGKREPRETMEACMVRELEEELGIQVSVRQLLRRETHHYPEKTVHLYFFLCDWISGEARALDCQDFRWICPDELWGFKFPEGDDSILKDLVLNQGKYFGSKEPSPNLGGS